MSQPTPEQLEAEIEAPAGAARRHRRPARPEAGREGAGQGHGRRAGSPRRRRHAASRGRCGAATSWSAGLVVGGGVGDEPARATQGIDRDRAHHARPRRPAQARRPDRPQEADLVVRRAQGLARVRRRPVHRPGRGADLLRRAGHLPGRARAQRHPRAGRPVGEVRADGPRRARARSSPRTPSAPSSPTLLELATSQTAGLGAASSVRSVALWSASGYVGAFGRAMNRIYEIGEGRPFWKLRPIMLLITLMAIVLVALVLLMLVVSGPLAQSIGDADRPGRPGRARSGTSSSGR